MNSDWICKVMDIHPYRAHSLLCKEHQATAGLYKYYYSSMSLQSDMMTVYNSIKCTTSQEESLASRQDKVIADWRCFRIQSQSSVLQILGTDLDLVQRHLTPSSQGKSVPSQLIQFYFPSTCLQSSIFIPIPLSSTASIRSE